MPTLYNLAIEEGTSFPFTYYSCIAKRFCMVDHTPDNSIAYTDTQGKHYTQEQFDSLLPLFYYHQLFAENLMPSTIDGESVTIKKIKENNFYYRLSPTDISSNGIPLYILFESKGKRVNLEMPDDYFRFTKNTIEFIDVKSNKVNQTKSKEYTEALNAANFKFPAKAAAGIPSIKKNYDEGYFITDNSNNLFHLKMTNGKPFIKNTGIGITPKHVSPTDYLNREFYAFVVGENNSLYTLGTNNYNLQPVPIKHYNTSTSDLLIMANFLHWNIVTTNAYQRSIVAINTSRQVVDSISHSDCPAKLSTYEKYIFPFSIHFTSHYHNYFKPEIEMGNAWAWLINILLIPINLLIAKRKQHKWLTIAITLISGVYGILTSILLLGIKNQSISPQHTSGSK